MWTEPADLFVHPRTVALASSASGFIRDLEGMPTTDLSSADVSFHALRDYVPGDDRRHIHWKTTARTNKLMVRQFEETRRAHLAVSLSINTDEYASEQEFEMAISVAASIGRQAIREQRELTSLTQTGPAPLRNRPHPAGRHDPDRAPRSVPPRSTSPAVPPRPFPTRPWCSSWWEPGHGHPAAQGVVCGAGRHPCLRHPLRRGTRGRTGDHRRPVRVVTAQPGRPGHRAPEGRRMSRRRLHRPPGEWLPGCRGRTPAGHRRRGPGAAARIGAGRLPPRFWRQRPIPGRGLRRHRRRAAAVAGLRRATGWGCCPRPPPGWAPTCCSAAPSPRPPRPLAVCCRRWSPCAPC